MEPINQLNGLGQIHKCDNLRRIPGPKMTTQYDAILDPIMMTHQDDAVLHLVLMLETHNTQINTDESFHKLFPHLQCLNNKNKNETTKCVQM